MVTALLGSAWKGNAKEAPHRAYFDLRLELGVMGALPCRVVENTKRAKEHSPTHLAVFRPVADGDEVWFGAFWPFKHPESGSEYLIGRLDLGRLGVVELKGGAKLDLRLVKERTAVRLSELRERRSEKGPTHQLWLVKPLPRTRAAEDTASDATVAPAGGGADAVEDESVEGEELDSTFEEV